jgi:hypothetical protein
MSPAIDAADVAVSGAPLAVPHRQSLYSAQISARMLLLTRRAGVPRGVTGIGMRAMSALHGKKQPVQKLSPEDQGVSPVGTGVPVGTPRENWEAYGYATRCASVVKVSDFAMRRVNAVSLPIVLGSTFVLDSAAHGARLHEKKEAPYADGDGYVYGRWGSPTNEGAARQLAALEGVGPGDAGGCMLFSSGMSAITAALMATLKGKQPPTAFASRCVVHAHASRTRTGTGTGRSGAVARVLVRLCSRPVFDPPLEQRATMRSSLTRCTAARTSSSCSLRSTGASSTRSSTRRMQTTIDRLSVPPPR